MLDGEPGVERIAEQRDVKPQEVEPFDVRRHALTRLRFLRRMLWLSRRARTRSPIRAPASDNLSSRPE
jgi:hypothetical protein